MDKKKKFEKILKNIKEVKIQGATNVAKAALYAYSLLKTEKAYKKLIDARPTEPLLFNTLSLYAKGKKSYKEIMNYFKEAQEKINLYVEKLIKNNDVIMTHCHSTNVVEALIYAKNRGKKFEVYNTETRPLYQGRKTAKELAKAGIKITMFEDAAINIMLERKQGTRKVKKVFLGCDAILDDFVINKVGSEAIAKLAKMNNIPFYIISFSLKYYPRKIKIEERKAQEIWKYAPKSVKIKNPAFETINKKYVTSIISELGILTYEEFIKKVKSIFYSSQLLL